MSDNVAAFFGLFSVIFAIFSAVSKNSQDYLKNY